ncbi:MAG: hypothetical protein IKP86_13430 [Anaerolineaceae bacterium]|nr:hypothetical protein [Anaerolineaceae bacterium]
MENGQKNDGMNELYRDEEGRYRWTYELIGSENHSYRNTLMFIMGAVILIPGIIMFFMIFGGDFLRPIRYGGRVPFYWDDEATTYLLVFAAVFVVVEGLTVLICYLMEKLRGGSKPMSYAMDEKMITTHANDRLTPQYYLQTSYSYVTDIRIKPKYDEIDLLEFMRVTQVYVYPEDMPFVLNFLFEHLPQKKKILRRKEEYRKYLEN